jgi:hypothetical protein
MEVDPERRRYHWITSARHVLTGTTGWVQYSRRTLGSHPPPADIAPAIGSAQDDANARAAAIRAFVAQSGDSGPLEGQPADERCVTCTAVARRVLAQSALTVGGGDPAIGHFRRRGLHVASCKLASATATCASASLMEAVGGALQKALCMVNASGSVHDVGAFPLAGAFQELHDDRTCSSAPVIGRRRPEDGDDLYEVDCGDTLTDLLGLRVMGVLRR